MSENEQGSSTIYYDVPQAIVRRGSRFGLIWLIPIVAALVGIGLAVKAIIQAGPTITITFKSAEGLEAGKTRIKYKDVEIGKVESIRLSEDLAHVTVIAKMVKETEDYLTADTRFWVVRARLAAGEVSGLGTLFSGAFIAMDPGQPGKTSRDFTGLERPPVVSMDTPGSYYYLRAADLGSLEIGSPVYYRQIKVGQVVSYDMTDDGSAVIIRIFIQAPDDRRVRENTRFWDAGGLNVTVDTKGININTGSLVALLIGGIAFETPMNLAPGEEAKPDHTFILYSNRDQIEEPVYTSKLYFITYFDESVRGLVKGAPVEFRGIKIGQVLDVRLEFDQQKLVFRTPVLMAIEPERITSTGERHLQSDQLITKLISKGLCAQLRTGVLLTGQLYISLSMQHKAPPKEVTYAGPYPIIPAIPGATEEITTGLANFINRLEKLPVEEIGGDLSVSLKQIKKLVDSEQTAAALTALGQTLTQLQQFSATLNTQTAPQMSAILDQLHLTVDQAQKTLIAAQNMTDSRAPLAYDLQQMMQELAKAGRAVSVLADYLQRHPEALIYGKGAPPP
ncbi:MAG: MlaD family protein [Desulfobacteraceae bacterium]|nr:MlaD family protein [Desulfobacteraceae bacterium]